VFGPGLRIGMAIVLGLFFCALVAFNLYSMRIYAKAGAQGVSAARVIRIINAILLVVALGLVIWAMVR